VRSVRKSPQDPGGNPGIPDNPGQKSVMPIPRLVPTESVMKFVRCCEFAEESAKERNSDVHSNH